MLNEKPADAGSGEAKLDSRRGRGSESVLVCHKNDADRVKKLFGQAAALKGEDASKNNTLSGDDRGHSKCIRAILEILGNGTATTVSDVRKFFSYAFCKSDELQAAEEQNQDLLDYSLQYLVDNNFVTKEEDNLSCTQMGCAAVSSSLSPQEALNVYADLKTAMNGLVLASDLHMVYLVTPVYLADMWTHNFSWSNYFTIWCKLCDTQRRIGELVGVDEAVLVSCTRSGRMQNRSSLANGDRSLQVHMRFYNALALFDLLEETPIEVVAEKYGCNRGHLQSLQQQAATFAGMITTFCDRLGWHSLTAVLQGFGERLAFGVKRELTELVKIDGLDRLRARSFHRAGFNTLAKLAQASLKDIAAVLRKAVPFHEEPDDERCKNSRQVWLTGHPNQTLMQASQFIRDRARILLQRQLEDLGIMALTAENAKGETASIFTTTASTEDGASPSKQSRLANEFSEKMSETLKRKCKLIDSFVSDLTEAQMVAAGLNVAPAERVNEPVTSTSNTVEECCKLATANTPFLMPVACAVSNDMGNDNSCSVKTYVDNEVREDVKIPLATTPKLSTDFTDSQMLNALECDRSDDRFDATISDLSASDNDILDDQVGNVLPPYNDVYDDDDLCSSLSSFHATHSISQTSSPSEARLTVPDSMENANSPSSEADLFDDDSSFANTAIGRDLQASDEYSVVLWNVSESVSTTISWEEVCSRLKHSPIVAVALALQKPSSQSFVRVRAKITGVAVSFDESNSFFVQIKRDDDSDETSVPDGTSRWWSATGIFQALSSNEDFALVTRSANHLFSLAMNCLEHIPLSRIFCLETAAWLLNPDRKCSFHDIVRTHLSESTSYFLKDKRGFCPEWCIEACAVVQLYKVLRSKLEMLNLWNAYVDLELPCILPLLKMQMAGLILDVDRFRQLHCKVNTRIAVIERQAFSLAGRVFQLSSYGDVRKVLYSDLGLPPDGDPSIVNLHRTGSNHPLRYSTAKCVLEKLSKYHPLPQMILEWRRLHVLLSNLSPLLGLAKEYSGERRMFRISGAYDRFTATGRILICGTNMQTTPRTFESCDEVNEFNARSLFVAPQGFVLLSSDFAQLELRIAAHLSDDHQLISDLNNSVDVFDVIGSCLFQSSSKSADERRQRAKKICYGVMYGMGFQSIASTLNVTTEEAEEFVNSFMQRYSGVAQWISSVVQSCRKNGFVVTLFNRIRFLPHITSGRSDERHRAERQAVNSSIQGSAADVFKKSIVALDQAISSTFLADHPVNFASPCFAVDHRLDVLPVLQLHDEVIFEVRTEVLTEAAKLIKSVMESAVKLKAKLLVHMRAGPSWGEMKPLVI